jgi:hypothetical protein
LSWHVGNTINIFFYLAICNQCCKNTGNFCLGNITGVITVFLVILGNICKNITISNKSSKNINCMYSATLKIYTFDRNLKNFTL